MSTQKYIEIYNTMSEGQKQVMLNLYMSGVNHDGHVMCTFTDIEDAVATVLHLERVRRDG